MLRGGWRPGRDDARLPARPGRRRRGGPGEARRLPPRLPRRHDPPLDARAHARARPAGGVPARCPHQELRGSRRPGRRHVACAVADFTHLPTRCKFIAIMPQWDFLDFLAEPRRAAIRASISMMRAEVTELIEEAARVDRACAATAADGPLEVRADSWSPPTAATRSVRERAGLRVQDLGAPDGRPVVPALAPPGDPEATMGRFDVGSDLRAARPRRLLAVRLRHPQGLGGATSARRGLDAFRASVVALVPFAGGPRAPSCATGTTSKLLTVRVDRLRAVVPAGPALHRRRRARDVAGRRRRHQPRDPGRGGRGQPALASRSARGGSTDADLRRGAAPARMADAGDPAAAAPGAAPRSSRPRWVAAAAASTPPPARPLPGSLRPLARIPARLVGVGVRPEHVQTPERAGPG